MNDTIRLSVRDDMPNDSKKVIDMFLNFWLQEDCNSPYTITDYYDPYKLRLMYNIRLQSLEDATFLKIKGIPYTLRDYVTLH